MSLLYICHYSETYPHYSSLINKKILKYELVLFLT